MRRGIGGSTQSFHRGLATLLAAAGVLAGTAAADEEDELTPRGEIHDTCGSVSSTASSTTRQIYSL